MPIEAAGAHPTTSRHHLWALPPVARVYVVTTIALGAAAFVLDVSAATLDRPALFVELLALAILTSTVKIAVPLSRSSSSLSLSFAVTLAAIPILGGTDACLIGMASAWSQCTFRTKSRNPWHRTLFSIAMVGVSVHVALLMFDLAREEDTRYVLSVVRPILMATTGYFVVNSMLLAGAIGLSTRRRVITVWVDNFLWSAPTYFVAGAAAILGVIAADTGSHAWATALIVPLYLTYRSYRTFVRRIEDEQAQVRQLSVVQLSTIEALALAIEVKGRTSQDHIHRIQKFAEGLARAIDMPEQEIPGVRTAALLHDIGNLAVPEHILVKPSPLSHEEYQKVKIHPRVGADIVRSVPFPYPVASLILSHHERWDGTGYPMGLRGEEIPVGARVLAVVDCFTAVTAERPYRPARGHIEAIALLNQESGKSLDPALVCRFLEILPSLERELQSESAIEAHAGSEMPSLTGGSALDHIVTAHREAQVMYEIAEGLGTSLSLDDAVALLASKLPEVLPFSCGALFLWDADAHQFRCRRAIGLAEDDMLEVAAANLADLGTRLPTPLSGAPLRSVLASALVSDGRVVGALVIYDRTPDVYGDDQRRLLERVSHQAASVVLNAIVFEQTHEASLTDTLTGLANRRSLFARLDQDLARARREQARVSVVLLDLDGLKHLNDTYGHDIGDRALCGAAGTLSMTRRPYDFCARNGGDEFVVVLWDCTAAHADARRRELQRSVAATSVKVDESRTVVLSISAGVATYPEEGSTAEALLALADQRMYEDKALRRRNAAASTAGSEDTSLLMAV